MDKVLARIKRLIPRRLFVLLQPVYHFCLSWLAAAYYRFPSEKMIVVGITGTTGKTSSVYLAARLLSGAGYKVGYTSTAIFNNGIKEWLNDKKMTMAGRFFTQKMIRDMYRHGCQIAIIETSSEGIKQFRHRFINYDYLVFTNLYPEHIESHGSYEKYKAAKGRLFKHLSRCRSKFLDDQSRVVAGEPPIKRIERKRVPKTIIANGDDPEARFFLDNIAEEKWVYCRGKQEDWPDHYELVRYGGIKARVGGTVFSVEGRNIDLKLLGEFNAVNAMSAAALARAMKVDWDIVKKSLEGIDGIAGRLEAISEGQDFGVIVDYAFEPKALSNLYAAIDHIPHQRIIHVLGGTGGGRDRARRPVLGKMAGEKADLVIVTNEDPYDEDPVVIMKEVATGAENSGKKTGLDLLLIEDRRQAIKTAISQARPQDLVLITGKGSEQAICSANGEKIPWDDRAVARAILKDLIS